MEISPDGAGLRPRSRFAKFMNLPELQQMFRACSDVRTAEMLNFPRPHLQGGNQGSVIDGSRSRPSGGGMVCERRLRSVTTTQSGTDTEMNVGGSHRGAHVTTFRTRSRRRDYSGEQSLPASA